MFLEIPAEKQESIFGKMVVKERDYTKMKQEADDLLALKEKGVSNVSELEIYFKRWEDIATRLVAGRNKIDKIENGATRKSVSEFENKLVHLYRFLLKMLGYYDMVIQSVMEEFGKPQFHKQMQARILNILL